MASVQQYLSVLAGAQSGANAEAQRAAAQMQIEVRAMRRPRPETTRRCPTFLFNPAAAGLRARSPLTTARSPRRVSSSLTHARTSYRSIQQLKTGDPRNAINVCMQLIARGQPLEARHFGYGVLQHVVAKRWSQFTQPERQELAKLVYDKLSECGAVPADEPPEPFMIKSKVATLMAQVVRQEGVGMWSSIMPEMAAGACSESPVQAELSALVMRYVAEDVAVYNSDILGGRMKELLYGLTSTLPQALPAMYRMREWALAYSTKRDGISLKSLYRRASGKANTVLLVSDSGGAIFGAFCTEAWKVHSRYGGTGESFVFTLAPEGVKYAWSGANDYYMFGAADSLSVGGGSAHAIRLEEDLLQGSSGECETFQSPPLASENMFRTARIELWSLE